MKKLFYLLLVVASIMVLCVACERDNTPWEDNQSEYRHHHGNKPDNGNNTGDNNGNNTGDNNGNNTGDNNGNNTGGDNNGGNNTGGDDNGGQVNAPKYTITKLYSVVMRREIPYPFKAYVLQISDGNYFYMLRLRYDKELRVGDKISFGVFSFCPNEIAQINGVDLGNGTEIPEGYNDVDAGEYLVASDPIEATVKSVFSMKIRYSITIWPIDTWFIETTDGYLLYVKKSKLDYELRPGDRFVYSVYTLFPNEVLAIKKL